LQTESGVKETTRQCVEGLLADRPVDAREIISRAVKKAVEAHQHQERASGEPYYVHALAVAEILNGLKLDYETLAAAMLHDVVEDTGVTLEDIEKEFGPVIARLVDGVTKMDRIGEFQEAGKVSLHDGGQAESLRKLLLAMAEDVRVVLIKLADRLHNMRTLEHLDAPRRQRIAQETLDIYAPLANRLGIWQVKWELEDLALRHLEPDAYRSLAAQ